MLREEQYCYSETNHSSSSSSRSNWSIQAAFILPNIVVRDRYTQHTLHFPYENYDLIRGREAEFRRKYEAKYRTQLVELSEGSIVIQHYGTLPQLLSVYHRMNAEGGACLDGFPLLRGTVYKVRHCVYKAVPPFPEEIEISTIEDSVHENIVMPDSLTRSLRVLDAQRHFQLIQNTIYIPWASYQEVIGDKEGEFIQKYGAKFDTECLNISESMALLHEGTEEDLKATYTQIVLEKGIHLGGFPQLSGVLIQLTPTEYELVQAPRPLTPPTNEAFIRTPYESSIRRDISVVDTAIQLAKNVTLRGSNKIEIADRPTKHREPRTTIHPTLNSAEDALVRPNSPTMSPHLEAPGPCPLCGSVNGYMSQEALTQWGLDNPRVYHAMTLNVLEQLQRMCHS